MNWQYTVLFVEEQKLEEGMKEVNEKDRLGWELISVVGVIGPQQLPQSENPTSKTIGYNFFLRRRL
jgi:hypothetical protein